MKKSMIPIMASIIVFIFAGYVQARMPNPSSVYCSELGYQVKVITEEDGGQYSICVFPDGNTCDAWQFLQGTCGEEYSYCAINGYDLIVKTDGKNPFSGTYAVCVDGSTEIGNPLDLMGITERLSKPSPLDELPTVSPSPEDAQPVMGGLERLEGVPPPTTFDWRTYNGFDWMTPVKDQTACGSCWAFGSVGTVEAVYNLHQNQPNLDINLSEEYVNTDCNGNGKSGCCGGKHEDALTAIRDNGVPDDVCLVYDVNTYSGPWPAPPPCSCDAGDDEDECRGTCPNDAPCSLSFCDDACFDVEHRLVKIEDYHSVGDSVADIKAALISHGPLTTALNFSFAGGQSGDGVWYCNDNGADTNHCVIITGWDDTVLNGGPDNERGAWIIKNSWGNNDDGDGYRLVRFNDCNNQSRAVWVQAKAGTFFPSISIPNDITFDNTCVGETSLETLNICNTGKADLSIYEIASNNAQFQVTTPLLACTDLDGDGTVELPDECTGGSPVNISPDFCYPFEIQFTPTSPSSQTAELTVRSSDIGRPSITIDATGNGAEPDITTSIANSGDFGNVCIGDFKDLNLTINNSGDCNLNITGISSSDAQFQVPSGFSAVIAPGTSQAVPVRFAPTSLGVKNANISITSNDPDTPTATVAVFGTAPPGDIQVAIANSGDFGEVCKGGFKDLDLTLFNQGHCDLEISAISITQAGDSFELPSDVTFPLVLSHDADFTLPIRYDPDVCNDAGETATIVITSDDPDESPVNIQISGSSPCPNLVIDPSDITALYAFPATVVDTEDSLGCYSDRTVTLRNNGNCPLTISDISAAAADFTVMAPTEFPVIVPTGEETLEVTVRFTPQGDSDPLAPSEVTGSLTIISDDPDASGVAPLCGESSAQSGVRILVTDISSGTPWPVDSVDSITLSSQGKNLPSPINLRFTDQPLFSATVCGNDIAYHINQETLPETGTSGSNPRSSYSTRAREGNLQAAESFTLGQCEFRDFQLQLQDEDSPVCLLKAKGEACETDGECCSGKCKGKPGAKACR